MTTYDRPDGLDLGLLPLLEGCAPATLDRLRLALRQVRVAPGELLMCEGEPGDTFVLILDGRVEVSRSVHGRWQHLAYAAAGSILGELAVLCHRRRGATVTAVEPTVAAIGSARDLLELLDDPVVLRRVRELAAARLAQDCRAVAAHLGDGTPVLLRPLLPRDKGGFSSAVRTLSVESRRRRFFSPSQPTPAMVDYLVDIDYVNHFAWLVLDARSPHGGWGTGRYVREQDTSDTAELAFGVIDRFQGRGIGTLLLGAVGVAAGEAGVRHLVGNALAENASMRAVIAKAGVVTASTRRGVTTVEVAPDAAAGLLEVGLRGQLRQAVHDIVTAASLALTNPP